MKLTLIRGLPGSGKSTMAKAMGCFHVEADMFHVRDGVYQWDLANVKKAHAWCARMVEQALEMGMDVVVSNTFVKRWEMERYEELAREAHATLNVIVATGNYKDVHDVPAATLARMRESWEE